MKDKKGTVGERCGWLWKSFAKDEFIVVKTYRTDKHLWLAVCQEYETCGIADSKEEAWTRAANAFTDLFRKQHPD